jgi:hypothetical protein
MLADSGEDGCRSARMPSSKARSGRNRRVDFRVRSERLRG